MKQSVKNLIKILICLISKEKEWLTKAFYKFFSGFFKTQENELKIIYADILHFQPQKQSKLSSKYSFNISSICPVLIMIRKERRKINLKGH